MVEMRPISSNLVIFKFLKVPILIDLTMMVEN